MPAETVITARNAGTTAQTATAATVTSVGDRDLNIMQELNLRLEVTTKPEGSSPTFDLYLQRATQPSPGGDDWQDFYHFPQVTDGAVVDLEVVLPLPRAADVDGSLGSYSNAVVQESLAADTVIAGHWGEQIRIREVVGGTSLTQGCVYSVHVVGR